MKPYLHAIRTARKFGGDPEEYLDIHEWFDQTKKNIPDMRHRAILHNSFGIYLATDVFGHYFRNSENRMVSVRDIGEGHVLDDLGFIPTLEQCFNGRDGDEGQLPYWEWFGGMSKKTRVISMEELMVD
jgi:hypothetical protein